MQGFLHCVWPLRMHFCAIYFYSKKGHNSVENDRIRKKIPLFWRLIYKKVFLKYQVNARFLSSCLVSENAIFGGGKRREKNPKSRQGHRGSRQRAGCPNNLPWTYIGVSCQPVQLLIRSVVQCMCILVVCFVCIKPMYHKWIHGQIKLSCISYYVRWYQHWLGLV